MYAYNCMPYDIMLLTLEELAESMAVGLLGLSTESHPGTVALPSISKREREGRE